MCLGASAGALAASPWETGIRIEKKSYGRDEGLGKFGEGTPNAVHPVVARHPGSGRPLLFVNGAFTKRIVELPEQESDAVLGFLCAHCSRPEWSFRFRWQPHSIAMWDNRCAQHFAVSDYLPSVRSGYRVQIDGVAPPVAA